MAVFRLERTRDYTVMSNHHLRDKRLSLKAKGLLSQMLSLAHHSVRDAIRRLQRYYIKHGFMEAAVLEKQ